MTEEVILPEQGHFDSYAELKCCDKWLAFQLNTLNRRVWQTRMATPVIIIMMKSGAPLLDLANEIYILIKLNELNKPTLSPGAPDCP